MTKKSIHTVHRHQYDPEMVEMFSDELLGIPSSITCTNATYNLDDESNLHDPAYAESSATHSFHCDRMVMEWHTADVDDTDPKIVVPHHRDGGLPAMIVFNKYSTQHHHGVRTGFSIMESWTYLWYEHGALYRPNGPHSIQGSSLSASIDSTGTIRVPHHISVVSSWNHPGDKKNITEAAIAKVLLQQDISIDRLRLGPSVFDNPIAEMAFYSTV